MFRPKENSRDTEITLHANCTLLPGWCRKSRTLTMGISPPTQPLRSAVAPADPRKRPFYSSLWVQVLFAMGAAIVLGWLSPTRAIAMKPLGDAFIKLITM